ncbi:MAG: TVP38/TMEM64 family protein [Clostridium sp.]
MKNTASKATKIKFAIFVTLFTISIICVALNFETIKNLDVNELVTYIKSQGALSIIVFLLIFSIKPFFLVIPANVVAIGGGILFGTTFGFGLSMLGFFISGTIAFFISRSLGREFVEGLLGNKFMKLDDNMESNGFKILFLLRLPPILPYDPLSYASGLTKIKYKDFILASVLGVVPETFCYSVMGSNINNPKSAAFIMPIILVIAATVFSKKIMDMRKKAK